MSTVTDTSLLAEASDRLARGEREDLAAVLTDVEVHAQIEGTNPLYS
jgi:hypothetical protein